MYHSPSKQEKLVRLIAVYSVMGVSVVVLVTLVVLFVFGFRFDTESGHLEQYSFLQFSSKPSGATVTLNGSVVSAKTPNGTSTPAGKYDVVMWRDGYETWNKTIDAKAGIMTWLNYARLVPKDLTVEPVANYESVYSTLASPDSKYMLIGDYANVPTFNLVDLSSDVIKSTVLTIPIGSYSKATTHVFKPTAWDEGGRYVLVKHTYDTTDEWLVLDTQDVTLTKNITRLFNLAVSNIKFSGTSGNIFYALDSGDIRRLDLSVGTISRPLVSGVDSFDVYDSNIITYNGVGTATEQVVGLYREGDDKPYVLRTVVSADKTLLHIVTAHYFNEDYVVITEGKKVDIFSGSYPNTTSDNANNLKLIKSLTLKENVGELTFSPTGEHVFIQSGAYFASYDLEYQTLVESTIESASAVSSVKWLDDNYIWSDCDGKLTIREFDGANIHTINSVITGQDVMLTHNGRYLYSINKLDIGYQLQRVRMTLP